MCPKIKTKAESNYMALSSSLLKEVLLHVKAHQFNQASKLIGDWLIVSNPKSFKEIAVLHPVIQRAISTLLIVEQQAVISPKKVLDFWETFEKGLQQIIIGCEKLDKAMLLDGCVELAKTSMHARILQSQGVFASEILRNKPNAASDFRREVEQELMKNLNPVKRE
jgi:hypothetical protein